MSMWSHYTSGKRREFLDLIFSKSALDLLPYFCQSTSIGLEMSVGLIEAKVTSDSLLDTHKWLNISRTTWKNHLILKRSFLFRTFTVTISTLWIPYAIVGQTNGWCGTTLSTRTTYLHLQPTVRVFLIQSESWSGSVEKVKIVFISKR